MSDFLRTNAPRPLKKRKKTKKTKDWQKIPGGRYLEAEWDDPITGITRRAKALPNKMLEYMVNMRLDADGIIFCKIWLCRYWRFEQDKRYRIDNIDCVLDMLESHNRTMMWITVNGPFDTRYTSY